MTSTTLDRLCINTIRTLSMDAVQQANSGHPGTPMAMAPVAYALWQRHLRFDPDDPIWPNRDRFVLSMGHASMLLYSMLHLAGVKAVNPKYETLGEPSVSARRHQALPAARQPLPRASRVSLDLRRRDDDRPARPGRGDQRRHGDRVEVDGGALQPSRVRDVRLRRLRARRRRLHDGRHLERSRVAGRTPEARQPVLDLRQQPHHDRGPDVAGLQRRRGHALHRLRLERHPRRRRQRSRDARSGVRHRRRRRPIGRR